MITIFYKISVRKPNYLIPMKDGDIQALHLLGTRPLAAKAKLFVFLLVF